MKITDVRIQLADDRDQLIRAFCSITIEGEFAVRDIRIIEGPKGLFVAMPSRKMTQKCFSCSAKMEVTAKFCSSCGTPIPIEYSAPSSGSDVRLFSDIAHPINAKCRAYIEDIILAAYETELARTPSSSVRR